MSIIAVKTAEKHFQERLDRIISGEPAPHCLLIKLSSYDVSGVNYYEQLLKQFSTLEHPLEDIDVYVFSGGDLLLLSRSFRSPHVDFVLRALETASLAVQQDDVTLLDLANQNDRNIVHFYVAKQQREYANAAAKESEKQVQREKERQTQQVLDAPQREEFVATIAERRTTHSVPEIMIIEDDVFTANMVKKVIGDSYHVVCHHDGLTGLQYYARQAPHVLFLDINLPDVQGHEIIPKITAMDHDAYIVMLSGNCDKDNVMQAMQLGAKGFVGKPFNKQKLLDYIAKCHTISEHPKRYLS